MSKKQVLKSVAWCLGLSIVFIGLREASFIVEFVLSCLSDFNMATAVYFQTEFGAGIKLLSTQFVFWLSLAITGAVLSRYFYESVSRVLVASWVLAMVVIAAKIHSELFADGRWMDGSFILLIEVLISCQGFIGFFVALHSAQSVRSDTFEQHLQFAICILLSLFVFAWFNVVNHWVSLSAAVVWLLAVPLISVLARFCRRRTLHAGADSRLIKGDGPIKGEGQ